MGVSLPGGGGGGRGKNSNFDLNLVPFIDLLSVNITFLMATAVWTQISTMQVDQSISTDPPTEAPPEPPTPPLTVHVRSDGLWLGRSIETGKNYPKVCEEYDWEAVRKDMDEDRQKFPEETQVVIVTDDGVDYQFMIKALDCSREKGYDKTLLGGGPASVNASLELAPDGAAGPG